MTSSHTGHGALSLSASVIMAYSTFTKATGFAGILQLLFLGILLPPVLVSGQTSSPSATSMPSSLNTADPTTTATAPTSGTPVAMAISSATTATVAASTIGGAATSTAQPSTTAISGVTTTSTTQSFSSSTPTSITTISSNSTMSTSQPSSTTGGMSGTNGTTPNSAMSMIYCPSFTCNYSDCYTKYTSENASSCAAGAKCQLMRQMDMSYNASCSASCSESCFNATQTDCCVSCCNFTGCLNGTFASMMMTTTTTATTEATTTAATTAAATSPQTSANNGDKCHKGSCAGATCYIEFGNQPLQTCSSSEPHCQLKKETVNSGLQWTAGCTTNCSGQTACRASTQPPCHLECCNATVTSCLWLNGTLNVPSSATRGPRLNTESMASFLCLLAVILLR